MGVTIPQNSLYINNLFDISEVDLDFRNIFQITSKLVIVFSIDELGNLIFSDYAFACEFFDFVESNKFHIKKTYNIINKKMKNTKLSSSIFVLMLKIFGCQTVLEFVNCLRKEPSLDTFKSFLSLLFIYNEELDEKYREVSFFLEDERKLLDNSTYKEILKKEVKDAIKEL